MKISQLRCTCNTRDNTSYSGKDKTISWQQFIKNHLLTGIGRHDNVHAAGNFECLLYGIEEKGVKRIDSPTHHLFVKAKCRDVLPTGYILKDQAWLYDLRQTTPQ